MEQTLQKKLLVIAAKASKVERVVPMPQNKPGEGEKSDKTRALSELLEAVAGLSPETRELLEMIDA